MIEVQPVSLFPEDMREGGGLWEVKKVRFTDCEFISDYQYTNKGGTAVGKPAGVFHATLKDLDDPSIDVDQIWSMGEGMYASNDGKAVAPKGDKVVGTHQLTKGSNFGILIYSALDAFPDEKKEEYKGKLFNGMAKSWNGLEATVLRKVVEGRDNLKDDTGKKKESYTVVIDVIHRLPWQAAAPGGAKAGASAAAPAKAAGAKAATPPPKAPPAAGGVKPPPKAPPKAAAPSLTDEDIQATAVAQVKKALATEGMNREDVGLAIFTAMAPGMERDRVITLVGANDTDEWLQANAEAGGWYLASDDKFYLSE